MYARIENRKRHIRARIEAKGRLVPFWRQLVNLGYASDLQELDLEETLRLAHEEAGFVYGRICRISDLIVTYTSGGREYPDFTLVFSLLDQVLSHHMIPFLELGNKSFMIQTSNIHPVTPHFQEDSETYYARLLPVLPSLLRSLVNHYGAENISQWMFEVSYNYKDARDMENFSFAAFLSVFRKIRQIIHAYAPRCLVGGPGFNGWQDPGALQDMLEMCQQYEAVPDFYSVYLYPLVDLEGGDIGISPDPDLLTNYFQEFTAMVQVYAPQTPTWVTECNSNLSARNSLNDAGYQAAFLLRQILSGLDGSARSLGYYLLSDAPLRYMDTVDICFGGWGLLTDTNLAKPSFALYQLLKKLGAYQIYHSSDCLVTANSAGNFQILLCRYCHPGSAYLADNIPRETLLDPPLVFTACGKDVCRVQLTHAISGLYLVRDYTISTEKTSLLKAWQTMAYLNPDPSGDFRDYFRCSELIPQTHTSIVGEDGIFSTEVTLTDIEVRLIVCELYSTKVQASAISLPE